jgi:hypothetical protein
MMTGEIPAATAAAEPELEPPEFALGFRGFRVGPNLELYPDANMP